MDILNPSLIRSFKTWEDIDKATLIKNLEDYYNANFIKKKLIKVSVINNKFVYDYNHLENSFEYKYFKYRADNIMIMFNNALKILKKSNERLKNFVFYFTVNDYNVSHILPIYSFAKPMNSNGILIPDWTFINDYKSMIKGDWDTISREIKKGNNIKKKNIIFFQGTNSSELLNDRYFNRNNIRKNLEILSKNNPKFIINIDKPPVPASDWNKYKYLLDLAGSYPWSVRLKEILLTKSLVIKVDNEIPWMNFYSPLLKPNIDYIQIKYKNDNSHYENATEVYNKIISVYTYMNSHPDKMQLIVNSGYKNMNKLTMDVVIDYIVLVLKLSEKMLHIGNTSKTKKTKISKKGSVNNKTINKLTYRLKSIKIKN